MSDAEFDKLHDKLKEMDPENPFLKQVGAPAIGTVMKHRIPMGSQEKIKDKDEYNRWVTQINNGQVVIQWKLDGSSVALYYKNGKLTHALTRGDGIEGEVITENVLRMQNVKAVIQGFTGSLRGEIILSKSLFEKHFKSLGHKNPRNTGAGLARNQKEGALQQHLKVIYYDIENGGGVDTELDRINKIKGFGLDTVETVLSHPDKVYDVYHGIENKRDLIDLEIDGIIVRANDLAIQKALGESSDMRPKGQRCIKFTSQKAKTTLKDINITIGHTGAMVPTGILEPVEIGGVTVSNVLLNNYDYIASLGLTLGCTVEIERAGDVIPHVSKLVKATDTPIPVPVNCIVCNSKLKKVGVHMMCVNDDCEGKEFQLLKTWVTKREIKFLGDELLAELYENHGVKKPHHLYMSGITQESLAAVKRGNGVVGSASKQIMAEIDKSRQATLPELLGSLGIQMIGRRQVEIMMGLGVDTLEKFLNLTVDQLISLPGFSVDGSKAPIIVAGLKKAEPEIQELLKCLTLTGVEKPAAADTSHPFGGKSFCFTGVRMKPEELAKFKAIGAVEKSGVAKGLDFLVTKDAGSGSSKMKKAESLGVKILSLPEFLQQLG
jgi:DNA ligase (NAD+)